MAWLENFNEREQREIDFARLYGQQYDHGTPGHLHITIIGRLAALLDQRDGVQVAYAIDRVLTPWDGTIHGD